MHKLILALALPYMPALGHAQVMYQRVLEPAVGDYSAVVGAVPKGTDGAVLLAEYADLTDTTDSGYRLFEVDGLGEPLWSRRFTFDSLGYAGGYDAYLTRYGTKLLAEHPDGGYVFTGKAPGLDSTGLLLRTDAEGALLWWKETGTVPRGLLTFPNGDVVVYGTGAPNPWYGSMERFDNAGDPVWEVVSTLLTPITLGVALSDTTMVLVNGDGIDRHIALVSGDGVPFDAYYLGASPIDVAVAPDGRPLVARSNVGPPQTHAILRFDEEMLASTSVFMDAAPVKDLMRAMAIAPSNGMFLTGERRTADDDSGHVVVYGLDADHVLQNETFLDPNDIGTYPTWRSIGHCLAACADGSVVVGGMADEDDGITNFGTGYYARLADPSTRLPNTLSEAFSIAQLGSGRFLITVTAGTAEELLITDVLGQNVERTPVRSSPIAIDLSHHASGVNLVTLRDSNGPLGTQRITVE